MYRSHVYMGYRSSVRSVMAGYWPFFFCTFYILFFFLFLAFLDRSPVVIRKRAINEQAGKIAQSSGLDSQSRAGFGISFSITKLAMK